jgi:hypothetical protein
MTVEMAMGHALQHIDKLYDLLTTANINRYELRGRVDTLEKTVSALQSEIARLTTLAENFLLSLNIAEIFHKVGKKMT